MRIHLRTHLRIHIRYNTDGNIGTLWYNSFIRRLPDKGGGGHDSTAISLSSSWTTLSRSCVYSPRCIFTVVMATLDIILFIYCCCTVRNTERIWKVNDIIAAMQTLTMSLTVVLSQTEMSISTWMWQTWEGKVKRPAATRNWTQDTWLCDASALPQSVHIEDCEGWWLSGCCSYTTVKNSPGEILLYSV